MAVWFRVFFLGFLALGDWHGKKEIGKRRDGREEELEQPDGWHGDQSEGAEASAKERAPVLPHALERAEAPAEALFREAAKCVGGLSERNGLVGERDGITLSPDRER